MAFAFHAVRHIGGARVVAIYKQSIIEKALRYTAILIRFVILRSQLRSRPVYVCLSSDVDPWDGKLSGQGWSIYEHMLAKRNLTGKITHLINPVYGMVDDHDIYDAIYRSGSEIGLHCHLEGPVMNEDEGEISREIERQKEIVESYYRRFNSQFRVQSFRSGTRTHSPALFRVLAALGILYDSTLSDLGQTYSVCGFHVDDRGVPPRPYYFYPNSYKSESGPDAPLLELPVSGQVPNLKNRLHGLRAGEPLIIVTYTHPYNFAVRNRRNYPFIIFFSIALFFLHRLPGVEFLHMRDAAERWAKWRSALSS